MNDFLTLARFISSAVTEEAPRRVLEISLGGEGYAGVLRAAMLHSGAADGTLDRIALPGAPELSAGTVYDSVRSGDALSDLGSIGTYDLILILDLLERMTPPDAYALLDALSRRVTGQILILTPLKTERGCREHHPVTFIGLDFCYSLIETQSGPVQAYGVFPHVPYRALDIDSLPADIDVRPLSIAFILPHAGLTGGMKALLLQIERLTRRGHTVSAYLRSNTAARALPEWSGMPDSACTRQIVVPEGSAFTDYITDTDVIVLGWLAQIPEFAESGIPVVLWEQGSEMMYGDYKRHLSSRSPNRAWMHMIYRLPVRLLAVSEVNIHSLKGVYNRDAVLYNCGIDTELYHPGEKGGGEPVILLVGSPALKFKGFPLAHAALRRARESGARFSVKWVAQFPPAGDIGDDIELIINPPQTHLAKLYRTADIYLSTSLYESYPLPPLEAMASGTAVVATDCGGIRTYARDGVNCILCPQSDEEALSDALIRLLNDPAERERLAINGRRTALEQSVDRQIERLERLLCGIAGTRREQA